MSNNNTAVTHLLSLPNELFPYLFNYLSSSEILKAFLELSENNVRLASLIMPYLCYINLSHESNFWLSTRLPKFNEIIHSICATTRQLAYLRDLPSLQILTIVEINSTDELVIGLQSLSIRLSQLDSIKLNFCLQHDIYHLHNNFDIPLKNFDLSLRCSFLPTESLISSLRHLTICVNTIRDLFQLGQQLPMIESLFVNVYGSSAESHSSLQEFNSFIACSPYLKRIALYSQEIIPPKFWRLYPIEFEYFEIFIRGCSSSLEYLTLDLILQNQTKTSLVDGDRLEQELSIVSSQIVDWNSNICSTIHRNLLILNTVRSITISPMSRDAILTLDLFRWMITSFPRLRCLKLTRKNNMEWQLEDETISYPIFDTVRILYLHGQFSCQLIRRFLFMCPRLKYLNVSRKALLKQIITEPELNNDSYLKNIYQQILQIELSGSGDYVDFKGQLRDFFPRAYFL
ncbi:unnamed protein product [Rotaria sordida]|uniref:F-box domain-containing protein n=1 Tax=Rotaria sordida TaxID=392033 RepID=A0A815EMG7_9BILA|nr:unnamed protein product [Rotaria sordida]